MNSQISCTASVVQNRDLTYPDDAGFYSPSQAFPEYPWAHVAQTPNLVYSAVRECLAGAGLDAEHFGRPSWNPLGEYVHPGQKVFLLCNFVKHNVSADPAAMLAKCTHGSVIRALADYVLIGLKGRGLVRIGNSPLQSADWTRLAAETGAAIVERFYSQHADCQASVQLADLRQHIVHQKGLGTARQLYHGTDSDSCVSVDLGRDSLLDEFYSGGGRPRFRVLDYDFRRTEACHSKGRHVYRINKAILESDLIVSIPKLKTHEKVGITCGIKGCVGTVGHKDCLAHHRRGAPRAGGDEYPDRLAILDPVSKLHDVVYTRQSGLSYHSLHFLNQVLRMGIRRFTKAMSGAWPGNDTCWRMALDLARIVEYADSSGKLHPTKQRRHIMLTDGIVAGEGDGPLRPEPVDFGYLSFADNIAAGDYLNCLAMGFDPQRIPMIREAFHLPRYPLAARAVAGMAVTMNGTPIPLESVAAGRKKKFRPPSEWRGRL